MLLINLSNPLFMDMKHGVEADVHQSVNLKMIGCNKYSNRYQ